MLYEVITTYEKAYRTRELVAQGVFDRDDAKYVDPAVLRQQLANLAVNVLPSYNFV